MDEWRYISVNIYASIRGLKNNADRCNSRRRSRVVVRWTSYRFRTVIARSSISERSNVAVRDSIREGRCSDSTRRFDSLESGDSGRCGVFEYFEEFDYVEINSERPNEILERKVKLFKIADAALNGVIKRIVNW